MISRRRQPLAISAGTLAVVESPSLPTMKAMRWCPIPVRCSMSRRAPAALSGLNEIAVDAWNGAVDEHEGKSAAHSAARGCAESHH